LVRVKICGLTRPEDVDFAVEVGADALGFVLEPTSPRYVGEEYEHLTMRVPPFIDRVAVFGRTRDISLAGFEAVQAVEWPVMPRVSIRRIHALRVQGLLPTEVPAEWLGADALLLDSYKEGLYGGTGLTMDWEFASSVVRAFPKHMILAGGLTPENVAEAIRIVRPYAVDVSSGVESSPGVKDHGKMRAFVEAARGL
jgi:phosphoribosylanthranilate isomerase